MSTTILAGDFTVYFSSENGQKRIEWTGSATGTRTCNELYSALQNLFDDPSQMDDVVPIRADTPDIYRLINEWFIDDTSAEHLTGGSLYSSGWVSGGTQHVLIIGYAQTTEFHNVDIGRTIRGATTADTGTILDFNTDRNLIWIRPDVPTAGGDEFDNGTETYSIGSGASGDAIAIGLQEDISGAPDYVDVTTNANTGGNYFEPFPTVEGDNDSFFIGFSQQFSRLVFDRVGGTQGTVGVTDVYYSQGGGTWAALTGISDATGATGNGTDFCTAALGDGQAFTFTVPTDWATDTVNGSAQLYFIRIRINVTVYTVNPTIDQVFVSGVGAGAFAAHTRHGSASVAGESAWAGITSEFIGTDVPDSHVYIYREDPDAVEGGFSEVRVVATKGANDWWSDGSIDTLLKVREADNYFGQLPGSSPAATVAILQAHQYSRVYGSRKAVNLPTAGGNISAPLSAGDDLDNTTGYRSLLMSGDSGNFVVDDRISHDASTPHGVILAITGTTPTRTLVYYLINEPQSDFIDTNTVTNLDDTGTGTVNGAPANTGPASDTTITITSGATTENINNGNGARPYSVRINPATLTIEEVYERTKYLTRFGEITDIDSSANHMVTGEEYVGNELQLEYDTQTGNFAEGLRLTGTTSTATGIIVADHDDGGATGDLILRDVRGTFADNETITDSATGSADILAAAGRRSITPISAAPFGTFAGGTFYGAPGVCLTTANLAAGDEQAYQLIDDNGVVQVPPNTRSVEVTNLVSGDTVAMLRLATAAAGDVNKSELTTAAGNNRGDADLVVAEVIDNTHPTAANSKVRAVSTSGEEHRYRYDSFATSTFTLSPASTGTDDGGGSTTTIVNAAENFVTDEVEVGDMVFNTTDLLYSIVTAVAATTLTVTSNGTTWAAKGYSVNTLVETYPAAQNVYVPFIERIADAANETNTIVAPTGAGTINVWVVVRNAGVIQPFDVVTTIINTGRSQAAIRTTDDIFV